MKINWKVRLKNPAFIVPFAAAVAIAVQCLLNLFGVDFSVAAGLDGVLSIVTSISAMVAALGVVIDPTTKGMSDSERAMDYVEPGKTEEEAEEETEIGVED